MSKQLRKHPLAELIREISAANVSGALRLARDRVKAVVYIDAGKVIFASSNLRAHRLAESLRRWGTVTEEVLSSTVRGDMSDAEVGAALVAAGVFSDDELTQLQTRQVSDTLRTLLLWTEGYWDFDPRARLAEGVRVPLDVNQLLIESARRLPTEFIITRLERDEEGLSPIGDGPAELELLPTEAFVLSRAESRMRVGELISISGLPEAQARQIIYALVLGGLLERQQWPQALSSEDLWRARNIRETAVTAPEATATAPAAPPPFPTGEGEKREMEDQAAVVPDPLADVDALFAQASGADYYEILGVSRNAETSEIKRAYYALAKRFHPDRFHKDADPALRSRIESSFAQIAQAYETLKDASPRAAYDRKLEMARPKAPSSPLNTGGAAPKNTAGNNGAERSSFSQPPASPAGPPPAPSVRAEESFQKGLAALKQNNYLVALTHLGEAARLVPTQPRYRAIYGQALARDARTRRQAEAEFQAAIKLDGRNVSYRVMLAELYRDLGLLRRADGELERALAIDPQHAAARRMLSELRVTSNSEAGRING